LTPLWHRSTINLSDERHAERERDLTMTTKKLNDGCNVLAVQDKKYGLCAKTFANLTQARNAAEKLRAEGVACEVIGRRPFYVCISE
jgi:hypothetical protein